MISKLFKSCFLKERLKKPHNFLQLKDPPALVWFPLKSGILVLVGFGVWAFFLCPKQLQISIN